MTISDRPTPSQDVFNCLKGKRVILLLEDLSDYIGAQVDLWDFVSRLSNVQVSWTIIATCRDGPELTALQSAHGKGLKRLYDSINNKLSLVPATAEEKELVAKGIGKEWDEYSEKLFPRLGLITMAEPIHFMRERFKSLPSELKDTLRAIRLLTCGGVPLTQNRVQIVLKTVFKREKVLIIENLEELGNQGFICPPVYQDPIITEPAYLIETVTYVNGKTLKDDMPLVADALTEINDVQGLMSLGQTNQVELGDRKFAQDCLERAFCIRSFAPDDWGQKGFAYLQIHRYQDALEAFEEFIKINPEDVEGWSNKAICLTLLDQQEEALKAVEKALSLDPNNDTAQLNKAVILDKLGRLEESLNQIEKVTVNRQVDIPILYNKGGLLMRLNRFEEALDTYSLILKLKPESAQAWEFKAELLVKMNRFEEAIKSFNALIKLRPDLTSAWSNKGFALAELNRNEEALAAFRHAVDLEPNQIMLWFNIIATLQSLNAHQAIIEACNEALKIKPKNLKLLFVKAKSLEEMELTREAIDVYEQILRLNSQNHIAWFKKGLLLKDLHKEEEALKAFNYALKLKPNNRDAQFIKGILLYGMKHFKGALKTFEIAYKCNLSNPDAWFIGGNKKWLVPEDELLIMKAFVLAALGSNSEALIILEEILDKDPENYKALTYKGRTLIQMDAFKEGIFYLDRALKINPTDPDSLKKQSNRSNKFR